MSFVAIAGSNLQYEDFPNQFLKAFEPGTVDPKLMANDDVPTTTFAKLQLNSEGFPETTGGAEIIPFIDGAYDLWLFPTEAEADANDTNNARQLADDIENAEPTSISQDRLNPDTVSIMTADTRFTTADVGISVPTTKENTTGSGGSGTYDIISGTGTANGFNIIAHDTNSISFVLRPTSPQLAKAWGVGETADDTLAGQDLLNNNKHVLLDNGNYKFKDLVPNTANTIECESEDTKITGVAAGDDIIATTGSLLRVKIFGGDWNGCRYVWNHTGDGALAYCIFQRQRIRDVTRGFSLSASVGNAWNDPDFGSSASTAGTANISEYGIVFTRSGVGATNINWVNGGFFHHIGKAAIAVLAATSAAFSCNGLHIRSWFEECKEGALLLDGNTSAIQTVDMSKSHLENCGDADNPDISMLGTVRSVDIFNNNFATPTATGESAQVQRIKCTGNSSFEARDNFTSLPAKTVLASVNGGSAFETILTDNFINNTQAAPTSKVISGATQANPCVITISTDHDYVTGEQVEILGVVGMVELNGRQPIITVLTSTTFSLDGVDSSAFTAYTSDGTSLITYKSKLFNQTGTQTVRWSNRKGSGGVSGDDFPTIQYENFTAPELTINAGVITVQGNAIEDYIIDTEGDASTDDLDTIEGGYNGQVLYFTAANSNRDVVFKDGTNLKLAGDFTLTNRDDLIALKFKSVLNAWVEITRSDNAA